MTAQDACTICKTITDENSLCVCGHAWYCHDEQGHCDHCDCRGFLPEPGQFEPAPTNPPD